MSGDSPNQPDSTEDISVYPAVCYDWIPYLLELNSLELSQ